MRGQNCVCSDFPLAAQVVQRKAKDDFIQSLRNFDGIFKDVGSIYLSGKFTGNGSFSPQISPLIGKSAQIISCAHAYRQNLSLFHSWGIVVPAPELFAKIKAFTLCLKHCTNPDKWDFFAELVRLLREFDTFIKDDRSSPMRTEIYESGLNEHIGGMTRLVSEDICRAVISREEAIGQHRATPIPVDPQLKTFTTISPSPTVDPIDYVTQKLESMESQIASINSNTMPPNPSRENIYDLVARIRADKSVDLGKSRSYKRVTNYIRCEKNPAPQYRDEIVAARNTALSEAKSCADGEDKFWNSIAGESRPSQRKRRTKSRNAAPGATPIPDLSWA